MRTSPRCLGNELLATAPGATARDYFSQSLGLGTLDIVVLLLAVFVVAVRLQRPDGEVITVADVGSANKRNLYRNPVPEHCIDRTSVRPLRVEQVPGHDTRSATITACAKERSGVSCRGTWNIGGQRYDRRCDNCLPPGCVVDVRADRYLAYASAPLPYKRAIVVRGHRA
jgi:hypothetical protein